MHSPPSYIAETPHPHGVGMRWRPKDGEPFDFHAMVEAYGLDRFSEAVNERVAVVIGPTLQTNDGWDVYHNETAPNSIYGARAIHQDSAVVTGAVQVTCLARSLDDHLRFYDTACAPAPQVKLAMWECRHLLDPDKIPFKDARFSEAYQKAFRRTPLDSDPRPLLNLYDNITKWAMDPLIPYFEAFYQAVEARVVVLKHSLNNHPHTVLCIGNQVAYHWATPNGMQTELDSLRTARLTKTTYPELKYQWF